jgi:hypothetical protein
MSAPARSSDALAPVKDSFQRDWVRLFLFPRSLLVGFEICAGRSTRSERTCAALDEPRHPRPQALSADVPVLHAQLAGRTGPCAGQGSGSVEHLSRITTTGGRTIGNLVTQMLGARLSLAELATYTYAATLRRFPS